MPGPYKWAEGSPQRNVGGGVPYTPQVSSPSRVMRRAASPLAAVPVCGGGEVCGRDEFLPYKSTAKRSTAVSRGPGMPGPYKQPEGSPQRNVGGGVPDAPQVSSPSWVMRRAASPLAAAAVCGSSKPYGLPPLCKSIGNCTVCTKPQGDFAADFTLRPLAWGGNLLYN